MQTTTIVQIIVGSLLIGTALSTYSGSAPLGEVVIRALGYAVLVALGIAAALNIITG